jgi:putative toxin-antitoxin system antitoxin component (TIGR02293 family)
MAVAVTSAAAAAAAASATSTKAKIKAGRASVPRDLATEEFLYDWGAVEKGLPLSVLDEFASSSGIPIKNVLEVVIPLRTLKHRRQRNQPLSMDESDRLAGVARMYHLAAKVYGDAADGRDWLLRPKRRFGGRTALSMLKTRTGEDAVQEALIQLDEGMFI